MSNKTAKQFSTVYMRVCYAEDLIHKISSTDPENHKLREIDGLLLEARQAIKMLMKRRVKKCPTCKHQMVEGSCQNYACETDVHFKLT